MPVLLVISLFGAKLLNFDSELYNNIDTKQNVRNSLLKTIILINAKYKLRFRQIGYQFCININCLNEIQDNFTGNEIFF